MNTQIDEFLKDVVQVEPIKIKNIHMKHVHLFQWNIPAGNHYTGETNGYINVIAEWNGDGFWSNGKPMIYVNPINLTFYECIQVIDWALAKSQIESIAQNHFAELASKERISKARAELIAAGELIDNPILDRYNDLITQQTLS